MSAQAGLFGAGRRGPGRLRRDLDGQVRKARRDGADLSASLLAAARSLADSIDACAEGIADARAVGAPAPTGQLMAHAQMNREYRETLTALLGVSRDRDPLDQLLADFTDAALRDGG